MKFRKFHLYDFKRRKIAGLVVVICVLAVLAMFMQGVSVAQTDPFVGTWKLNVSKSKFAPGQEKKSETRMVVTGPTGMKISVDRVNKDETTQEYEYTANLDGKSYPIVGQGPYGADSIATNLSTPNTIQSILKKDGKLVATSAAVVSSDGKSLTISTTGTDANGKQFTNRSVYDKQ
jgi:hypothetical protein